MSAILAFADQLPSWALIILLVMLLAIAFVRATCAGVAKICRETYPHRSADRVKIAELKIRHRQWKRQRGEWEAPNPPGSHKN